MLSRKSLIRKMTSLDAQSRPSFDTLLQSSRGTLFPETFYSFLHNYISSVNELRAPSPFTSRTGLHESLSLRSLPSDSDHRLERIWSEFDNVESYLLLGTDEDEVGDEVGETDLKRPIVQATS